MENKGKAIENFKGMNCNQAVLCTYGPQFGVDVNLCLKLGLAYGGGMGRQGKTCGAVTGAYTVIGLWSAQQPYTEKSEIKKLAFAKAQEFNRLFIERNGSLECKELLNYDLSIPEESAQAEAQDLFETVCPDLVGSSAEILDKILV